MQQNINKDYKKTSTKSVRSSILKHKQIADKLDISDRIDTTAQSVNTSNFVNFYV